MKRKRKYQLPKKFRDLQELFHYVDSSYVFLIKNNVPTTVINILNLLNSFQVQSKKNSNYTLSSTQEILEQLHAFGIFSLEHHKAAVEPRGSIVANENITPEGSSTLLQFKSFPRATKKHSQSRVQELESAMVQYVNRRHSLFLGIDHKFNIPDVWDPTFILEDIKVPSLPLLLIEEKKTAVQLPDDSASVEASFSSCCESWANEFSLKHGINICFKKVVPRVPAKMSSFPDFVPVQLVAALKSIGIKALYNHQLQSIRHTMACDSHVVLSTSTSSGKSLAYNIPVLSEIIMQPESKALYVFPTKALAQDQLRSLNAVLGALLIHTEKKLTINCFTLDGDTAFKERIRIAEAANILFSNPDMLSRTILPNHKTHEKFLRNLKFIVIDEMHTYSGIFGSHFSAIMSRLILLCQFYGAEPQVIACSATLANPLQHFSSLVPEFGNHDIKLVKKDSSGSGKKVFLVWNNKKCSPLVDAARVMVEWIKQNIRCIIFVRSRKVAELTLKYIHEELSKGSNKMEASKVRCYRGGYTKGTRREIERDMFEGSLLGIVATNALELGVDIGSLEATIHLGIPANISSLWQQAGRAGRSGKDSVSLVVCFNSPLDQYFARNPRKLFSIKPEAAICDPRNSYVAKAQLRYALKEMPASASSLYRSFIDRHACNVDLNREISTKDNRVSSACNIRAIEQVMYSVENYATGSVIDTIAESTVLLQVYPGAIYLNQNIEYKVKNLCNRTRRAFVEECKVNYYTKCRDFTDVEPIRCLIRTPSLWNYGIVEAKTRVVGYYKIAQYSTKIIESCSLTLPTVVRQGHGAWMDIPESVFNLMEEKVGEFSYLTVPAATHGINHLVGRFVPTYLLCDPTDLLTSHPSPDQHRSRPARIVLYESIDGGIGLVKYLLPFMNEILQRAYDLLEECPCTTGCPSCIHDSRCSEHNLALDKNHSHSLLKAILGYIKSPNQPCMV